MYSWSFKDWRNAELDDQTNKNGQFSWKTTLTGIQNILTLLVFIALMRMHK